MVQAVEQLFKVVTFPGGKKDVRIPGSATVTVRDVCREAGVTITNEVDVAVGGQLVENLDTPVQSGDVVVVTQRVDAGRV